MKALYRNLLPPCCIVLLCALLWRETGKMPPPNFDALGAAFFPRMNLGVLMLLSVVLLGNTLWRERRGLPPAEAPPEALSRAEYLRMGITLGMLLAYVLAVMCTEIHFIPLTFAYLTLFGWFLAAWKLRDLPAILGSAAVVSGLIYFIFGVFLDIFFP